MNAFWWLELLQTLLKLDVFFVLGLAVQLAILTVGRDGVMFGLTIAAFPLALVFFAAIGVVMRREIRAAFLAVILLELLGLGYVILAVRLQCRCPVGLTLCAQIVRILSPGWTWLYGASRDSTACEFTRHSRVRL